MEETANMQAEQTPPMETSGTQKSSPDEQSDRDELKEASQHFFQTLLQTGVHLAMTSAASLPEESREHFANAGREFTRGLAWLAQELADTLDSIGEEVHKDVEQGEEKDVR